MSNASGLRTVVVSALVSTLVASIAGLGVFEVQARRNMSVWVEQRAYEISSKILDQKISAIKNLNESLSRYQDFDAKSSMILNIETLRLAAKDAGVEVDISRLFPDAVFAQSNDTLREHREIWVNLKSSVRMADIYFDEPIGKMAWDAFVSLQNSPVNGVDYSAAVKFFESIKTEKKAGKDIDQKVIFAFGKAFVPIQDSVSKKKFDDLFRAMSVDVKEIQKKQPSY